MAMKFMGGAAERKPTQEVALALMVPDDAEHEECLSHKNKKRSEDEPDASLNAVSGHSEQEVYHARAKEKSALFPSSQTAIACKCVHYK